MRKHTWFLASIFAFALTSSLVSVNTCSAAEPAQTQKKFTRVLIVTGQEYPGHPWKLTAPALAEALQKDPRLQVRTVEDPHFLDSAALEQYDVILLNFMNWEQPAPGEKARENLRSAIESGKGLMLVHFACGAWQDWPEFPKLAGRAWDPKLRGHDPRGKFTVEIADPQHPITKNLEAFETDDELYTCLAGDTPIHIVAKARSKVDGKDYPMAFVLNYGKGRVFHCLLGHDLKAITVPQVAELYRQGAAWVAGLEPRPPAKTAAKTPVPLVLNSNQQAVVTWTERQFRGFFDRRTFEDLDDAKRAELESKLTDTLKGPQSQDYFHSISTLGALRSRKAIPSLLEIAMDRAEKNNRERWMAVRALGLVGDTSVVPELIHLVYYPNMNTRWWAQIALVQLTGTNFSGDWKAWGNWWNAQKKEPAFKDEQIIWSKPEWQTPEAIEEGDRKFLESLNPASAR